MDWKRNMHSKLLTQTPPMTPVDLSRQKQSYQKWSGDHFWQPKVDPGPLLAAKFGPPRQLLVAKVGPPLPNTVPHFKMMVFVS